MTEWIKQGNLKGPVGPLGPANEIEIGTVTTLEYTDPAYATITPAVGDPSYQILDLGIPRGEPGTGNIQWDDIVGVPVTFPPTLPIPWSGISGQPATYPPTLPIPWSGISGTPATFPPTLPIPWTAVSGKPATFPPTVPISWTDITGQPVAYPPQLPIAQAGVTNLVSDLAAKAPIASPSFTGNPTAPTPSASDNDTSIATTAFVQSAIAAIPAPPPGTIVSTTAPGSPQSGQMWWNTTRKELNIWDGTAWQTVYATWA